jgi:hypothetical protein
LEVLDYLEDRDRQPIDDPASSILLIVDSEHVREAWTKLMSRRESDPEGAITSARTLLESVCKHILDQSDVSYKEGEELPRLYRLATTQLKLSPDQHAEQVFRQILGGCQSIVECLGAIRNRLGDAHGKGKAGARPAPRHAALAVNLAGSMATFLIETLEVRRKPGK